MYSIFVDLCHLLIYVALLEEYLLFDEKNIRSTSTQVLLVLLVYVVLNLKQLKAQTKHLNCLCMLYIYVKSCPLQVQHRNSLRTAFAI